MSNTAPRWDRLVLAFAIAFGAVIRLAPTMLAGVPINDGGMFLTMIDELRANALALPAQTAYNFLHIPFAYPPLSLDVGAVLSALGVPTIEVVRWVPALVSTLSIVAFYWMASQMLPTRGGAAVAALVYSLMPRAFSWYVMGGGLSRAFGAFFLLLVCGSAWRLFSRSDWKWVLLTAALGAGAVLSHPETAVHAAAACVVIWLFKGRSRRSLLDALMVAAGVVAFTSPWWLTVLLRNGWQPFYSALQTGGHGGLFWLPIVTLNFAQEPLATLLTVLGIVGLFAQAARREWFLPAWTIAPFIVEPRSAPAIAVLPLAMLAACGLTELVLPALARLQCGTEFSIQDWMVCLSRSSAARIFLGVTILYAFFAAFAFDLSLAGVVTMPKGRAAMEWIRGNTPAGARFVLFTGWNDPFGDPTAEWFPVLAGRHSINTIQGQEWTLGPRFMPFLNDLGTLQGCLNRGVACVEDWSVRHSLGFDYIYIAKPEAPDDPGESSLLLYQLRQDARYQPVFENAGAVVFQKK